VTYPPPLHDPDARGFASDNYAGIHPEILAAIARARAWREGYCFHDIPAAPA